MDSQVGYPPKGWVAPFGDLGITGRSPLPRAFRSVPRPSSPLGAKASTRCPSRARPRPAPRPRQARPENRCASIAPTGATGPGVTAYPCPGTTEPPPAVRRPRRLLLSCPLHGHDSLHDVKTSTDPRHPCLGRPAPISRPGGRNRTLWSLAWQPTPGGGPGPT